MKSRQMGLRRGDQREGVWVTFITSHPRPLQVQGIRVPNQEFGLSKTEPGTNFLYHEVRRHHGHGLPLLSVDGATTVLQGMVQERGALTSPIFSFYLSR